MRLQTYLNATLLRLRFIRRIVVEFNSGCATAFGYGSHTCASQSFKMAPNVQKAVSTFVASCPSSSYSALGNLVRKRKQRIQKQLSILHVLKSRWRILLQASLLSILLVSRPTKDHVRAQRSCRRLTRNDGWWHLVWTSYSNKRFKQTFRVSRGTFQYILLRIRADIEKQVVTEEPVSPECRLAICLYRLGRGDYLTTISEMTGLASPTICNITIEVSEAIVNNLWEDNVGKYFPSDEGEFLDKMVEMESLWQFPCCFGAIDGCHIPIKCPSGGREANKEYHNFKNFYSIVLMAIVDAKYRFIWASCGYPGNSHDSLIFKSTQLYSDITQGKVIPNIAKEEVGAKIHPLILGDSAFPFKTWLMKPYTNAILSEEQRYFNYRLSRARMVTEGAYGRLKGRWRVLMRKCESKKSTIRSMTLACIVLHNICTELDDAALNCWDETVDQTGKKRPQNEVRDLLIMTNSPQSPDNNYEAGKIREALKRKFFSEKLGHGVF